MPPGAGSSTSALEPRLTDAEATLLRGAVAGRGSALEFGAGAGTETLLEGGVARLVSVDSDAAWLARVAAAPECTAAIAAGRLRLLPIDIGPVCAWGWPQGTTRLDLWPCYWRDAWDVAPEPELVFVDGRFRVAVALQAALRLAPGCPVLVHDFWSRPSYRGPLLRHFDIAASAGGLALLTARSPPDTGLLAADLAAYGFDPR